jgi:hypothetical protein
MYNARVTGRVVRMQLQYFRGEMITARSSELVQVKIHSFDNYLLNAKRCDRYWI